MKDHNQKIKREQTLHPSGVSSFHERDSLLLNRTPVAYTALNRTNFATCQHDVALSNSTCQLLKPFNTTQLYFWGYKFCISREAHAQNQKLFYHIGGDNKVFDQVNAVAKVEHQESAKAFVLNHQLGMLSFKLVNLRILKGRANTHSLKFNILKRFQIFNSGKLNIHGVWCVWTKNMNDTLSNSITAALQSLIRHLLLCCHNLSPQVVSGYLH